MGILWLVVAFLVFSVLIGSVYRLNRRSLERYGTEPFSLPNAALMLLVNLLLLSALSDAAGLPGAGTATGAIGMAWLSEPPVLVKLLASAALTAWMFWMITRRTSLWVACYAVPLMALGGVVILPSLVFRYLATAPGGKDSP